MDLLDYLRLSKKTYRLSSGIDLIYFENCSAGAERYSDQVLDALSDMTDHRQYKRAHEYWCGHAAYAFDILGRSIAKTIAVTDCFFPAVVSCEFTSALNGLDDKVTVYQADSVGQLPDYEMFDLVIGAPPWLGKDDGADTNDDARRICIDDQFQSHQDFFTNSMPRLEPGGDLILLHIYDPRTLCDIPQDLRFKGSTKVLTVPYGDASLWHFSKEDLS